MVYGILIIAAIALWGVYWFLIRPIWMRNRMNKGVQMVYMGLALQAFSRLLPHYGEEMAAKLSAAVANEVFSITPTTDESRQFLAENRLTVRMFAKTLSQDVECCRLLSAAMLVKGMLDWSHGRKDSEHTFEPVDKLKKLGLYVDAAAGEGFKHYNLFYYRSADYLGRMSSASKAAHANT